ncbi:MAG TPA: tetratricopeptide repeat-containing serine protease family protein [Stellaceae bacterium]|nr:tetratricopeptide repeat-containing serine protease family protein [Stellaceae bacterium]
MIELHIKPAASMRRRDRRHGTRAFLCASSLSAILLAGCATSPPIKIVENGITVRQYSGVADITAQAQAGDVVAERMLGRMYLAGNGVPKNLTEGARLLKAAATGGDPEAAWLLGIAYQFAQPGQQNLDEARRWYQVSAEHGYADGQAAYGNLFDHGIGVPENFAEALKWYRLAVAQNNPLGENNLGAMYFNGRGVDVDLTEGVRLLRLAALQKTASAQANLGGAYANGRGVPKNLVVAYAWYDLAATSKNDTERQRYSVFRDQLGKSLSPAELAQGQQIATTWQPGTDIVAPASNATLAVVGSGVQPAPNAGRTLRGSGTGFVVGRTGQIVTNAHVTAQCTEMRVRLPGADANPVASIVATDTASDLALLTSPLSQVRPLSFRQGMPRQGEGVVAYGFPLVPLLTTDGNVTTGNVTALAGMKNDSHIMQINAPVQPGNSGGPLVDLSGNLVGVVVAKLNAAAIMAVSGDIAQNVNFAIKGDIVRGFLTANNVAYSTAASAQDLKTADITERLKKATVLVECWR